MQYCRLNQTDLKVSRVAFGCMSTVGSQTYDGVAEAEAIATIHAAMDLGINFFDTARAYAEGEAERVLGKASRGRRDEVVIASKPMGPTLARDELLTECDQSLTDLGVDCIDFYQIHWPRHQVALEETADAMLRMVEAGKIRHIGVCNFGTGDLAEWREFAPVTTNQIAYNLLYRAAELELLPMLDELGGGVLCYSPLAQGLLAGRYATADDVPSGRARTRHFAGSRPEARHGEDGCEDITFEAIGRLKAIADRSGHSMADLSLAWLLAQPRVVSVLAGASRPDQVKRNAAVVDLSLDDSLIAELSDATDAVRLALGPSLDMWASPPRMRS